MPLPPPLPPKPSLPPPPPLKPLPGHHPLRENKKKALLVALLIGSVITVAAGVGLYLLDISINVILPVLAPIWIGTITLIYSVNSKT